MKKRFLSLLLCLALVLGLLPTAAFAADTSKAIQLGTGGISGPTKTPVEGKGDYYAPNSYVYFGVNSGNSNTPIKWRVLDADKTNDGATSGMFLLSEYLLTSDVQFNSDNGKGNAYQGSDAQSWCGTFANNTDNFSAKEQNVMLGIEKEDVNFSWNGSGSSSLTTKDKLFFLSAQELADYVGNYEYASGLTATNTASEAGAWWLRSPYASIYSMLVGNNGRMAFNAVRYDNSARPAFNLDLSSVLFTSAAKGGKSADGMDGGLTAVSDYDGTVWKLTLKDTSRSFSVTESTAAGKPGDTVTLKYSGATVYDASAAPNEYISVIIANSEGNATHYGRITQPTSTNGWIGIEIPSDLADGTYTLYVFSEQYNGDYKTDYASTFNVVTLTVDETAPTLTAGDVSRSGKAAATVKFTSSEAGTCYYGVVEEGASAPAIDTIVAGAACISGENTFSLSDLSGTGAKDVYIVVKDAAGNVSSPLKMAIPAYITPVYSISTDTATLDFGGVKMGYTTPAMQTVAIKNMGNQPVTVTLPVSTNYTVTAGTGFTNAKAELVPNGTATFTVQPKVGLAVKNYDETLAISGSDNVSAQVKLFFAVNKAAQDAPAKPELDSRTTSSITLKGLHDNANGAKVQYRMNGGDWQDSPQFTGLASDTEYSFTVRYGETDNYEASQASETATFRTNSSGTGGGGVSTYTVAVKGSKNGTVTADRKTAASGTTVTLTVKPNQGWTLETLIASNAGGKAVDLTIVKVGEKYTFQMPASNVTVTATFMEDNTILNYFVDVPTNSYYYNAVLWAVEQGITQGTDNSHFSPDGICTRAQAVAFLWRAAGSPAPKTTAMPFTDVPTGSYYYDAVLWAMENGITKGASKTIFAPNQECTRAQIVAFLYRSEQVRGGMAGAWMFQNPFTDVDMESYYGEAVMWAIASDVTEGTTAITFSPDADCTRAQIVTFLWRCMK